MKMNTEIKRASVEGHQRNPLLCQISAYASTAEYMLIQAGQLGEMPFYIPAAIVVRGVVASTVLLHDFDDPIAQTAVFRLQIHNRIFT